MRGSLPDSGPPWRPFTTINAASPALEAPHGHGSRKASSYPSPHGHGSRKASSYPSKIVFDKFHVMAHLLKGVDTVRKQEHRRLMQQGDESLKGTKYLWLMRKERFDEDGWIDFEELRESNLKTARARAIVDTFRHFWTYTYLGSARKFFDRWYGWAIRSRLAPIKKVARMLGRRLDNILTYLKHRITNAIAEGLNAKIQWIKYTARGFANRENFRIAILFHCGGLDLYPHGI